MAIGATAGAATIAADGVAKAEIVLPDNPSETEQFAAEELKSFLEKMTGAEFNIVKEGESEEESPRLMVGRTNTSGALADDLAAEHVEAFAVKNLGDDLHFVGACDRATLYAVYDYLETDLGCRFLGPGERWTIVPGKSTIELAELDRVEKPAMDYRFLRFLRRNADEAENPVVMKCLDWGVRLRVNMGYGTPVQGPDPLIEKRGGVRGYMTPHNLGSLVDMEKIYKEKPEWLALVDGTREPQKAVHFTNLCTAQPGVSEAVAEGLIEVFDKNPGIEVLPLGPGDGQNFCQCDECRALDTVGDDWVNHGGVAKPMLTERWLKHCNEVGEILAEKYPDKKIYTLGYHQTVRPPQPGHEQPGSNLIIQVVNCRPNNVSFIHRIEHPTSKRHALFRETTDTWLETTPAGIMIYQYVPHSQFRRLPTMMPRKFVDDVRWCIDKGMIGYEGQSNTSTLGQFMLPMYMISKMTWNPNLDSDALIEDYCKHAFGKAAESMMDYIDAMEAAMEAADPEMFADGVWRYLTPEVMAEGRKHLDEALAAVEDPMARERVEAMNAHFKFAEGCVTALWMTKEALQTQDEDLFRKAQDLADKSNAEAVEAYENGVFWVNPDYKKTIDSDLLQGLWARGSIGKL